MHVESKIVEIVKTNVISTEYIEKELSKQKINPLRWAIVDVSDKMFLISVADLKE